MRRGATLRFLALALALASCAAPAEVGAQAVTSHAQFASGYPTVTHHNGTNTLTVAAALDRAATAYFVVVQQPNGLSGGAVTEPTPDEIFAGVDAANANTRSDAYAAGALVFTSAEAESSALVDDLPDEAVYDVFFATHTGDPNASPATGTASPSSATVGVTNAATIPDVTPPSFAAETPFVAAADDSSVVVAVAASETATAYFLILSADAPPPDGAGDVVDGVVPENMSTPVGFHGSVTPPVRAVDAARPAYDASLNASSPLGGDAAFFRLTSATMRVDTAYAVYAVLADSASPPNVGRAVAAMATRTSACSPCDASQNLYLSGFSCSCVEGLTVTLRLSTTEADFLANPDVWLAHIARTVGVLIAQTRVVSYRARQGALEVTVLVLPLRPDDTETVDKVQFAANNGGETPARVAANASAVASAPSGAPDTAILPTARGRPRGKTSPMTDDARMPGHVIETPTDQSHATFRWTVSFGGAACAACASECKLDQGAWVSCTSPFRYDDLEDGEHNFRVRGIGGDATADPTPDRYTWTIRKKPEARFVSPRPPANTNVATREFRLTSNRAGATFEWSLNANVTGGGTHPFPVFASLGRDGSFPITALNVTGERGFNTFLARARADAESSPTPLRHVWNYDLRVPTTSISSAVAGWNNSRVKKDGNVTFVLVGDDADPEGFPPSGVVGFRVRLTNVTVLTNGANASSVAAPLFDYRFAADGLTDDSPKMNSHTRRLTFSLGDVSNVTNGAYVLSAAAVDAAGNYADPDASANRFGANHYHVFLTDEIPGPAFVTPATTLEDFMTAKYNDTRCPNASVACLTQLSINQVNPADDAFTNAYQITNITGGALFYADGVTKIENGDFVPAVNASEGLRFLNARDLNDENFFLKGEDGEEDKTKPARFGFIAWPSASFDQQGVLFLPAYGNVSVVTVNDPPVLNRSLEYRLDGVYVLDSVVTNFGGYVKDIIERGFFDIDGPFNSSLGNQGVVVLSADETRGEWQWSADDGARWTAFPDDLAPERPLLLLGTDHDRVRYVPDYPAGGGLPFADVAWSASFAFRAWDANSSRVTGERGWWTRSDNGSRVPPDATVPADVAADPAASLFDFNQPVRVAAFNATNASAAFAEAKGFDATWSWFDGANYAAYGNEISMDVASVAVDVFGLERSVHGRGGAAATLAAKESHDSQLVELDCGLTRGGEGGGASSSHPRGKAPSHGVAFAIRAQDPYASLVFEPAWNATPPGSHALSAVAPPWTIEAWVRRDQSLEQQALFTGADGGAILLETPRPFPGSPSPLGVASPATMAALARARADFDAAENNTALDAAAAAVASARAAVGVFAQDGVAYETPTREWVHLAFVAVPEGTPYRAPRADVRLYVNGLFRGVASGAFGFPAPVAVVGGPGRAAFAIDEVRVWQVAVPPSAIWARARAFLNGDEPGLLAYLPLEEGCLSDVANDRSAAALSAGREAWRRNGTYAPFYGSDAPYSPDWYDAPLNSSTTRATSWERREADAFACASVAAVTPAVISSAGGDVVTMHGSGFRGGVDRLLRFPTPGDGTTRNDTAGARAVCRFGRGASSNDAVIESPATIAADGESVTCVSPAFPDGSAGGGVVVVEFCDPASSCCSDPEPMAPLASRSLYPARFLPPSLTVAAAERARVTFRRAEVTSVAPVAVDARLGAVVHVKGWGFEGSGGAATCAFAFTRKRFVSGSTNRFNNSDPNVSVRVTVTSEAHIVSGAEATCELPALDQSRAPPGARLAVSVTLRMHGGAVAATSPTSILAVAADAAPGSSALELADDLVAVSRPAANASDALAYVRGAAEGGFAVALRTRSPEDEGAARAPTNSSGSVGYDPTTTREFPELTSGGVDAACAFGTVTVAARRLSARRVECVSPAAPRENATAPLSATARAAGARFDVVGVGSRRAAFEWVGGGSSVAGIAALAALYAERAEASSDAAVSVSARPAPFAVASQGGASGPADGGWLLSLRGAGFDGGARDGKMSCAFSLPARDCETAGSLGAPFATAPARLVSGSLIVCEVPAILAAGTRLGAGATARVSIRETSSLDALFSFSPPEREREVSFVEFAATAPLRGASLALADRASRVVAAGGGSVVGVVGGDLAETSTDRACRFRAVVVAARRGADGGAECASPALARRVTALSGPAPFAFGAAADLVDFAVGAARVAGMLGAEAPRDAGLGLLVAPATDGAAAMSIASPAPPRGAARAIVAFASLDAASAAPLRLALALNASSGLSAPEDSLSPPDWAANPAQNTRVSLLCVAGHPGDASPGNRASRLDSSRVSGGDFPVSVAVAALGFNKTRVAHSATCDAPPAPFERARGGFAIVSVFVATDGPGTAMDGHRAIVFGQERFAELELEWATTPRVVAVASSRDAHVPASVSRAARDPKASLARTSLLTPEYLGGFPFFVASGSGRAFRGFNDSRAYADADDMDLGGAWWHGDGAFSRRVAPVALAGADFRGGAGSRARFFWASAEASTEITAGVAHERSVVATWFVSSALVLVEPPLMPPRVADEPEDVAVDVTNDGGATFSDAATFHRAARARGG